MTATIYNGAALPVLETLPSESVHTCVTSPPYFGLRDYGTDGQLGMEPTPEAYVERLVGIFREVRRVLRDDGTGWINLGDSFCSSPPGNKTKGVSAKSGLNGVNGTSGKYRETLEAGHATKRDTSKIPGLKPKDLIGIPWMVAFALRADGWYLRCDIVWSKPNCMPESVTDRPTRQHEYIFLLSKSERYYYDHEAVKEDASDESGWAKQRSRGHDTWQYGRTAGGNTTNGVGGTGGTPGKRNRRSVWEVPTQPFPGAHFAVYPPALIEPCVLAGTSEKGCCPACGAPWERQLERKPMVIRRSGRAELTGNRTDASGTMISPPEAVTVGWQPTCPCDAGEPVPCTVLDPFTGSGTTGLVALGRNRHFVGIEINPDYAEMARRRIYTAAPMFYHVEVIREAQALQFPTEAA